MTGPILPRNFYARDTVTVARELLGKVLVHGDAAAIIVETEAYTTHGDLAAHSAAGLTPRTRVIFGPPGHAYVYLSYGTHNCLNIVAEPVGTPGCVLLRALEPLTGVELMQSRRPAVRTLRDLTSGPGKLTSAMGITLAHYGADLTQGVLTVREPLQPSEFIIDVTPRIGITRCADWPLRFLIHGNLYISR